MPSLSLYFPNEFPDLALAGTTYRLTIPRPKGDGSEWTIGRSPDLALTVAAKTVSRRHAAINYSYAANRWAIQDLSSSGGTWLNNQRLTPFVWVPIEVGDRIHLSSNPPISVVEDENDTINGDDDGPATVASTTPLATLPPASEPPKPDGYDDALYLAVNWLISGQTTLGKFTRFLLVVVVAAIATLLLSLLLFE